MHTRSQVPSCPNHEWLRSSKNVRFRAPQDPLPYSLGGHLKKLVESQISGPVVRMPLRKVLAHTAGPEFEFWLDS